MKPQTLISASFLLLYLGVFAQNKEAQKKSEMRIRIEKDENGKKTITERVINTSKMTQAQQDKLANKIQDSVLAASPKMAHVKVMIEIQSTTDKNENPQNGLEKQVMKGSIRDFDEETPQEIQVTVDATDGSTQPHIIVMRNLKDGKTIFLDDEEKSAKSAKIENIKTFLNNPNNEMLNIRFNSPEKGNVSISVINTEGQTIVKEEINDFSGEYVGQLKIGKQKGTFFVLVSQNGDGNMKRVVVE